MDEAAAETPKERGGEEGEGEDDAALYGRGGGGALEDKERADERALADAVATEAEGEDGGEVGDGDGESDFGEGGIESARGGEQGGGEELGEPDGEGDGKHAGMDGGRSGGAAAGAGEGEETRGAAEAHGGGAEHAGPPAERQADRDQGGDEQADGREGDGPDPSAHGGGFTDGKGVTEQGDGGEHKQRAQAPEAVEEEAGEGIGPAFGGVSKKMIQAGDLAADAGGEEGVVELADPGDGVSPGKAGAQALGGEEQVETGGVQGVGDAGEKEAGEQGERGNLAGGSGAELGPIDERSEGDHEPGRNESAEEAAKGERAEEGDGHAASVGGGEARLES